MAKREANIVVRLRDKASSGFKRLGKSVGSIIKPLAIVTGALAAFGGVVGGIFLKRAIDEAGSFGEQMSILAGLTQGTADELKALEEAARAAGSTTRFTATEAGQGLEELARGGQSASEAVQSLNAVLDLSAGNNQTVAESAQQAVTALNAFGLEAKETARVSDVYTRTAQKSAQTTVELAESMEYAAPIARAAGLSLEQTAAIVGGLADQGFRGSRGGTALRNALIDLQDPSSNFRKELSKLGINSQNFVEVLEQLEKKGVDSEAALRALGKRSGPAIQALVQGGTEGIRELIAELEGAEGAAASAAKAMEDNLPGALRNLNSAFSDLQIELTTGLTEELKDSVLDLANGLRNFTKSDTMSSLKSLLVETFTAGRETVSEFIKSVDFAEVSQQIRDFTDTARTKIAEFKVTASDLKTAFDRVAGGTQILIATVRAAFNALGVVISGVVTAATAGLEQLFKLFDKVTFGMDKFINRTATELENFRKSFADSTKGFADGFKESVEQFGEGWDRLSEINREGAKGAIDAVGEEIADPAQEAADHLQSLKDALKESGLSAKQLGEDVSGTGESFDEAADRIDQMSEALGTNKEATEESAGAVGKINDEWVRLKGSADEAADAQEGAAASSDKQADSTERLGEATGKQAQRTKDLAGNTQELSDETDEVAGRMVRLGGTIQLSAAAQKQFNQAMAEWTGGGTARYIQFFKRNLESALDTQKEFTETQERLTRLQQSGVSVTQNFAQANRELEYRVAELRGETEQLAEAREREQEQALRAQLQLAQISGDEERVEQIREYIRLNQQLEREQARQQREQQQQRQQDVEDAEDLADAEERAAGAAGTSAQRDVNITVTFVANTDPNGITLSERERQRLIDGVLEQVERDKART